MNRPADCLPILELEGPIVEALAKCPRLIVRAPTGSGKSTQVPQFLLDRNLCGGGQIVVMQPRRLAARVLARRVARERGTALGSEVGYQVRLDNCAGPRTRIKYETDGVILRQLLGDPHLSGVGAIVFDEFHERHLYADVMLGLALRLQRTSRPDLKLLVMSATLEEGPLREFLAPCEAVHSEGRQYPVTVQYMDTASRREEPVWDRAAREFGRAVRQQPEGDALIFMPGVSEIQRTIDELRHSPAGKGLRMLPLHGELRPDDQDAAMERFPERKVVVATNVAETSLTIDGVRLVIDSGLARKARFDPVRGINTLLVEKISRASADQRAGRAGRTAPGLCLRLWTESEQGERIAQDAPEVRRVDLAEVVLTLKAAGFDDVAAFPWLDAPDANNLDHAVTLLGDLGALAPESGALTDMGRRLLAFPIHPRFGSMLLAADAHGCVPSVALIAALSQERSLLLGGPHSPAVEKRDRALGEEERSDLLQELNAWQYAASCRFDTRACDELGIHAQTARRAGAIQDQFIGIAREIGLDTREGEPSAEAIEKCILAGFSDHVACRLSPGSARCRLVHGRRGTLDKASVVKGSDLLVATEIQEIGRLEGEVDVRLSRATAIETEWLRELFPSDLRRTRTVAYDAAQKRVVCSEQLRFRDLVIAQKAGAPPGPDEAAEALAAKVTDGTLTLKAWDHAVEQWIARVNLVARACPEQAIPPIEQESRLDMMRQVCLGAVGYKDIKEKPVWPVVRAWLSDEQRRRVDELAPERLTLANGRTPKVTYEEGKPPVIALRIQELYGVKETPAVAGGRVSVLVHVLAPNQRPVQITSDLRSFWTNVYPQVKKQLKARYPKHEWR